MTKEEERFIRELILQWKLGRVSEKSFFEKFGISIKDRYSSILAKWEARGDLSIRGEEIFLSRDALLRVDTLLHSFFLPEHRDSRYV